MRLDRRLLGWGTFFILLGAIPLAVRAGYLDAALLERWFSLWPLLLIGWGLGLVLRETPIDWLGGVVTTLTFGIMGGSFIATGIGSVPFSAGCSGGGGTAFQEQHGGLGASGGTISVELPCGQLTINGVDGAEWSVSGTAGEDGRPVVTTSASSVEIRGREGLHFGDDGRPTWNVDLPRETSNLGLSVTINAGTGVVNLDGLQLTDVGFTLNAGDLRVDATNVAALRSLGGTINAGSASAALSAGVDGQFTVNAGSLTVCLPVGAAVRVEASSTLGSNNLDELGLTKVGDDTWETAGYASAAPQAELQVTTNAGSFDLAFGGGCGA